MKINLRIYSHAIKKKCIFTKKKKKKEVNPIYPGTGYYITLPHNKLMYTKKPLSDIKIEMFQKQFLAQH